MSNKNRIYLNKSNFKMFALTVLILSFINLGHAFIYKLQNTVHAHSELVVTLSFFNDRQRIITGSQDNTVKVWSTADLTLLHTFPTFGDDIMNVGLHPIDNRIFVLVWDGNIFVYDPTTYTQLTTFTHPTGNGNYMVFDVPGNRFIIGGFDGAGVVPALHFYDATSYAHLSAANMNFPVGDQVNTMSLNAAGTHIAVTNLAVSVTTYHFSIYRLSDMSLISTFTDNTDKIRWAFYANTGNLICKTSRDRSIKCYDYDSAFNVYRLGRNWVASDYPYCMNFGVAQTIITTIGNKIVFYTTQNYTRTDVYFELIDVEPIFVLDSTSDVSLMASGMQNGSVSTWKYFPDPDQPAVQTVTFATNLAIGLGVGLGGFLVILITIVICCFCGCCKRFWKKKKIDGQEDEESRNGINKIENDGNQQSHVLILKDGHNKSDKSSDIDYDELMAHGTIIVIKDKDKKQKYLKKLKKKQSQDSNNDSPLFNVQGHIIIIRDDEHSQYKKIKNKKNISQKSSDFDYEQFVAEGNVIIIKDEEGKRHFVNKLKKKDSNRIDYKELMAEGNIIIIKGEDEQKIYMKQLQKNHDLKNIKHDKILADGDILIIKDKQKKKSFVQNIKKQLQKNNQDLRNVKGLQVAEQIIVIRGDDDDDDMTYQQLMAEGTVIVIKDDEVKKQYAKFVKKERKNQTRMKMKKEGNQEKSSEADYEGLMAEECIIVIKDDNDKRNYINFLKHRKLNTEKSSEMDYDELINNGNIMSIGEDPIIKNNNKNKNGTNSDKKIAQFQIKSKENDPSFKALMAEKNVVVINEENEGGINKNGDSKDLKEVNKTFPLKN